VFGGDVGGRSREDAIGGDGEIVHDGAAALHEAERSLGDQEHAGEICLDDVLPKRQGQLVNREISVGDAGVVDENIEALKLPADGAEEIVDGLRIADVAGLGQDFDFCRGEFPADPPEGLFVAAGEDKIATFLGKSLSDGKADAARGASNKGDARVQLPGAARRGSVRHGSILQNPKHRIRNKDNLKSNGRQCPSDRCILVRVPRIQS